MNATVAGAVITGIFTLVTGGVAFLGQRQSPSSENEHTPKAVQRPGWVALAVLLGVATGALGFAALTAEDTASESSAGREAQGSGGPPATDATSTTEATNAQIAIDEPPNGVPLCPTLTGSGTIDEGMRLWLVVGTPESDWYLSYRPAIRDSNEEWHLPEGAISLGVGNPDEAGTLWTVKAILLDKSFSEYLASLKVTVSGESRSVTANMAPFSVDEPPEEMTVATATISRNSIANC